MDYYESAEGLVITRERAKQEIAKHGSNWLEWRGTCVADMGDNASYDAQAVLAWLGY